MKLPRGISALELIKILSKFGYQICREKGSRIRLTRISETGQHNVIIPNHNPLRVTLAGILNDISLHSGISKEEILS